MAPPQVVVQTQPGGKSFARTIFTTLATTIFGFSLVLNIYLLLWTYTTSGGDSPVKQTLVLEGEKDQVIGVIGVKGVIMANTFARFDRLLKEAEKNPDLKALVIEIETPGGAVTASDQIYTRINEFREKMEAQGRTVPIVSTIGSLGTSGGYYVACATDYIFTERTGLTGNIGVLMPRFNLAKLAEKYGVEETTIASTGAPFKNAGSMFKEESPAETAYIQKIADDAFAAFKAVVKTARKSKLTVPLEQATDGRAFFAGDALEMGVIDAVGSANDAYIYAAQQCGLSRPHVVRYDEPPTLLGALYGEGEAMGSTSISFNDASVKIDPSMIHELLTPRLMYIWRGQ
jgi:protease-4